MTPDFFSIVMFVTTLILLIFGFPVAFTLAGSALIFAFLGDLLEIFNFRMLFFFPQRIYGIMINEALVAVPLFIFMGVLLEKTEINSNPKDLKNYNKGVWTLPPRYAEGDKNKSIYEAIGESDRMTLKFIKK